MTQPFNFEDPESRATVQQALEAFLAAESPSEMQVLVEEFPFMVEEEFEAGVQRMIDHAARVGEAEAQLRLQEQMALLYQILAPESASDLEQAVEAFLYADTESDAEIVFATQAELLRSDQAAQLLFGVEAGDPESFQHLESRRDLWQRLVSS